MDASTYDEDITNNPFFLAIKRALTGIVKHAWPNFHAKVGKTASSSFSSAEQPGSESSLTGQRLALCVPRRGTVQSLLQGSSAARLAVLRAHVLMVSNEDGFCRTATGQVAMLNTQEVTVFAKDGDAVERTARVLFWEDFVSEGSESFTVYCISEPLRGEASGDDAGTQNLKSVEECRQYLAAIAGEKFLRSMSVTVSDCLDGFDPSAYDGVSELADALFDVYHRCVQKLPRSARSKMAADPLRADAVHLAIETIFLDAVYDPIIKFFCEAFSDDDASLNKTTRNLAMAQPEQLGVNIDLLGDLRLAVQRARAIEGATTPLTKLVALQDAVSAVIDQSHNLSKHPQQHAAANSQGDVELSTLSTASASQAVNADDLVSMMCLLLVRSDGTNWLANINFMRYLGFSDTHRGISHYFLTTMEAAAMHLSTSDQLLDRQYPSYTFRPATPPTQPQSLNASGRSSPSTAHGGPQQDSPFRQHQQLAEMSQLSASDRSLHQPSGATPVTKLFRAAAAGDVHGVQAVLRTVTSSPLVAAGSERDDGAASEVQERLCHPLCRCERCSLILQRRQYLPELPSVYSRNQHGQTALHVAAQANQGEVVQLLLQSGSAVNEQDNEGATPLHLACRTDSTSAVLVLLLSGADPLLQDDTGSTSLHVCARHGHNKSLKAILWNSELDPLLNMRDVRGDTALHIAARLGFSDVVLELLQNGARMDLVNNRRKTAAMCAHSKSVTSLLSKATEMRRQRAEQVGAVASSARSRGRSRTAVNDAQLDEARRRQLRQQPQQDKSASRRNDRRVSFRRDKDSLDASNLSGTHSLLRRSSSSLMLESPRARDREMALLFEAIEDDDLAMVRYRLRLDEDSPEEDASTSADDETAASAGSPGTGPSAEVEQDRRGRLGMSASFSRLLRLSSSSDTDPLGKWARQRQEEGPSKTDEQRPLSVFSTNGEGFTVLHSAAVHGKLEMSRLFLRHGADVNAKTFLGHTPLHFACQYGHAKVVETLLLYGANVNVEDHTGSTPLHFACSSTREGSVEAVSMTLARGADVNHADHRGSTPLHRAASWGLLDTVKVLLRHGARPDLRNSQGKSVLDVCTSDNVRHVLTSREVEAPEELELHLPAPDVQHASLDPSGVYRKLGSLPYMWTQGSLAPATQQLRPLYERTTAPALYLFYNHTEKAWVVAPKVARDGFVAICEGDTEVPSALGAWTVVPPTGRPRPQSPRSMSLGSQDRKHLSR